MKNYYEILDLPVSATLDQIKKRYRVLAKQYHPDISNNPDDRQKFFSYTTAYKVLSDEKKRLEYNKKLIRVSFHAEPVVQKKKEIKVIYSRSLGLLAKRGFFLSSIPKRYRQKNDIKYDIEILIDYCEAQKGGFVEIDVPIKLPCPECASRDHYCHICDGKGYIVRATKIKVVIPHGPKSGEIFEVNLSKIKKGNLAVIRAQKLRFKIVLSDKKTSCKQIAGRGAMPEDIPIS